MKLFKIFLLLLIAPMQVQGDNLKDSPQRILVLNSYHIGMKWSDDITQGIKEEFALSKLPAELYIEYLDTRRFPSDNHWEHMLDVLTTKFKSTSFDLIIVTDNNAFNFVTKYRSQLYPQTPVVFCGLNFYKPALIENYPLITGIVENPNLKATIDIVFKLHPTLENIVFISDPHTPSGIANLEQLNTFLSDLTEVNVEIWGYKTHQEHLNHMKTLKENSILFMMGIPILSTGEWVTPIQQLADLSAINPVPIYSSWNFYLGGDIVGGFMINGSDQGHTVAKLGLKILNGASIKSIPVVTETPASYIFDYNQLKQFKIDKTLLPNDSIIINQPFSFYEEYKLLVWATVSIIVSL